MHSPDLPTQGRHRGEQELEQGQTRELWLQGMLSVVFVMEPSVQLMNQGA